MLKKELARDFVLGSLSPEARDQVARARLSDRALDEEIAAMEAQLAAMTGAAGEAEPPAGLFERIAAAIAAHDREFDGKAVETASEGRWLRYKPGIEAKRMWTRRTVMLRCQPGAVLPAHHHDADEHIIVVSGDFVVGGRSFGSGDYLWSPKGSPHADAFTRGGCLLLVQYGA